MVSLDDRRREWIENLRELKRKKEEELKELEDKKKKELEEAEKRLLAGVDELSAEEEEIISQLREHIPALKEIAEEKAKEEAEKEQASLEETVAREKTEGEPWDAGPVYEVPLERSVQTVYQASNYNVYNELNETLEKVRRGEYLSQQERESFYKRQEQFNRLSFNSEIIDEKDPYGYINRSKQVIDSIEKSLHSKTQYKTGDHI